MMLVLLSQPPLQDQDRPQHQAQDDTQRCFWMSQITPKLLEEGAQVRDLVTL